MLIRNSLPPQDYHRALGIVLLWGPRGTLLMSEVPLLRVEGPDGGCIDLDVGVRVADRADQPVYHQRRPCAILCGRVNTRDERKLLHICIILVIVKKHLVQIGRVDRPIECLS